MAKDECYHGKNILSYQPHTLFTGKEIKDWIQYHTTHETSKSKIAKKMSQFCAINDAEFYTINRNDDRGSSSCGSYLIMKANV